MRFIAYFAGRNAHRNRWFFIAMVVVFADTGNNNKLVHNRPLPRYRLYRYRTDRTVPKA